MTLFGSKVRRFLSLGCLGAVLALASVTAMAEAEESGVLLTNRAEKHEDNPNARIHPTAPDASWRVPKPRQTPTYQPRAVVPTPEWPTTSSAEQSTNSTDASSRPDNDDRAASRSKEAETPPVVSSYTPHDSEANADRDQGSTPARIRPDGMEGYRITEKDGSKTTVRPDGMGGYRTRSDEGAGSIRPDGMGGYRINEEQSNRGAQPTRMRPDGMGGYRITEADGSMSRLRPDGMDGYRLTDSEGNISRIRPDGMGGYRRR